MKTYTREDKSIRYAFFFVIYYFGFLLAGILLTNQHAAFKLREFLATVVLITASFSNGVHDSWIIRKAGVGDGSFHLAKTMFFLLMAGFIAIYGYLDKSINWLTVALMAALCLATWKVGQYLGNRHSFNW